MSLWCHCFDQNSNKNIVSISALKFFVASLGHPGNFFGLPEDLASIIINKEVYRKPQNASRKTQGSYRNFQSRNPYNIFVAILLKMMTPKRHFKINWPLTNFPNCCWYPLINYFAPAYNDINFDVQEQQNLSSPEETKKNNKALFKKESNVVSEEIFSGTQGYYNTGWFKNGL